MKKTGSQLLLDVLAAGGVKYLFGNPGSTELPLMDAFAEEERIRYILGVQEIPVMGMADGYAQASRTPGVVNLHISCGVGNAMGMLYNAWCAGSPLVVTAGQQDRRLRFSEPVLEGDVVSVTRPWTKWSAEIQRVEDLEQAFRRAIQTALTPPTGPVFLSLPVDLQSELCEVADVGSMRVADYRMRPSIDALEKAARALLLAKNPVILAGSRVTEYDAVDELVALAEAIGAPVYSEMATSRGRFPIPTDHPQYVDQLPLWSPDFHEALAGYDVAFVAGMDVFRLYIHHLPECPLPDGLRIVHMDSHAEQIGKNYPVEVGVPGDLKSGMAELTEILQLRMTEDCYEAAARRREELGKRRQENMASLRAGIEGDRHTRPMMARTLISALGRALPNNAVFVDEAPTANQNVMAKLGAITDPTGHFAHRGWALGWGLGFAMGVKLAWPERPVVAMLGDGAALYGIQGLWTAARYRIPVTFVIANNTQYKILKNCGDVMKLPQMCAGRHVGMDLDQPEVDFVSLAASFGVAAYRVTEPDELEERVAGALGRTEPLLLDVQIER